MRRTNLWPVAGAAITASVLFILGGAAGGGELGQMVAGYGLLLLAGALYMVVALAIRDRIWRRLTAPRSASRPVPAELQSRRVF